MGGDELVSAHSPSYKGTSLGGRQQQYKSAKNYLQIDGVICYLPACLPACQPIYFLFDIFGNSIYLTIFDHSLDLVSDYPFTSQRESHSVPDMEFFIILLLILSKLELSKIELQKLTTKFFNKKLWSFNLSWLINSIFVCSTL